MTRRTLIFILYLALAALLFVYRSSIVNWMRSESVWYLDIAVLLTGFLIAVIPAIPFGLFAPIMGAKYGMIAGFAINLTVSLLGAMTLFSIVRASFTQEDRRAFTQKRGLSYLNRLAERNAFMAILIARLLPFIPAQATNVVAALTRMGWKPFFLATLIGKIPFFMLVSIVGDQWMSGLNLRTAALIVCIYGLFLLAVFAVYRWRATLQ
ncbi:TVP38/TMEM64 family protein [Cohnella yongneupensis]|uniref:TVP38/TMEM64 family membrane protein n=1 Tax=Cohnella yongneupensis TaxID=425006 RepID=A0ABW0QZN1_9BACL